MSEHIYFCPQCFASSKDGSWGHLVIGEHCTNCGNPSTINIPEWAIKAIRQQASWVGKRYYPHEEDREAHEERIRLLGLVKEFPNRSAKHNGGYNWTVTQKVDNTSTMIFIEAVDEAAAMEASRFTGLIYTGE